MVNLALVYALFVFAYLMFAYAMRWFWVANKEENIKASEILPANRYKPFVAFLAEYILSLFNILIAIIDNILSLFFFVLNKELNESYDANGKDPLILVHGLMMRPLTLWLLKLRLNRAGWKNVYYVGYYSFSCSVSDIADRLKLKIEKLEELTGKKKFSLICHSMGGIGARYYISNLNGSEKVDRLVTLGTPHKGSMLWCFSISSICRKMDPQGKFIAELGTPPVNVSTLSIYSDFDQLVIPAENCCMEGGEKLNIPYLGHTYLLYNRELFEKLCVWLERQYGN